MPSSSSSTHSISSIVSSGHGLNGLMCIRRWNEAGRSCGFKICRCGLECEFYTSMTNDNPGRRFYRCPKYRSGGCGLWEWFDAPMCMTGAQLFPLLREEIREFRSRLKATDDSANRKFSEFRNEISKMKEDLDLCQLETESCMHELRKLRREKKLMENKIKLQNVKMRRMKRVILYLVLVIICLGLYVVRNG